MKKRDRNIEKNFKREISLRTKVQGKRKYSRKMKHRKDFREY